ncbi:ComEC/Rec2 family competence protein [Streptomyces sp. HNM0663]|uniref:ComEC/Rec2 family competence protein n=1 Tax=Streptomyces chengmaiensis TaxID=3040919 RepID=A0ABT6HSD6_9ACTN|nr:ComEC/Rec2 family competence protein [Streptomyces chengmaiensis]MDH2391246.1 ComEC/Rec2 family competence protein [Streptomyces chengmaiensis]
MSDPRNGAVAESGPDSLPPDPERPRRDGPADLRLVPPALAAWAASALALDAPGRWTATAVAVCTLVACLLSVPPAARALWTARGGQERMRQGLRKRRLPPHEPPPHEPPPHELPRHRPPWHRQGRTAAAALLMCAAAAAASAGLHGADLRRGPLPELARQRAHATVEVTVAADPRTTRPKVRGNRMAGAVVVLDTEATEVTTADRAVTATRTPLLVIIPAGESAQQWLRLLPSTRLTLTGRLTPPLRDGAPYAAVLRTRGEEPPRITGPPSALQRTAGSLRAGLREATDGLPEDARALLPGLVVGDTSRIGPELKDAFEATDLTHLLAVSGSNLNILLILLIGPPGAALLAERRGLAPRLGITLRQTALAGGAVTLAFVMVCRPEPSVLRAAACGAVTLLAIGTGRRRSLLPALAAAVLLLLLYDPWLSRSYGFLLSVLATGALLTLAPGWSRALQRRRVPPKLAEALAAAAAAQVVCAPVVTVFASRVSLVAIPCNLIAELAVAPATVLGFAALATAPAAMPAAELLARCAGWPAEWIASVARTGAALPGAEAGWPGGWTGGLLLAVAMLLIVLAVRRAPRHPWAAAGCALLLLLVLLRPPSLTRAVTGWPPPAWALVMCDVGQGDALVLATGDGSAVVVDTGPDPEPADRCLRELGVTRIPLVLLTHFHADHVHGLPGVLRGRAVGAVQTTAFGEPSDQVRFVRRTAAAARVPVLTAAAGERRAVGRLSWQVLWPERPERRSGSDAPAGRAAAPEGANDASVTLLLRIEDGPTVLLPGDLEPPAQRGLLRAHPALPPVDVLKVAHHGSAHQHPGLLQAVRPRLALISCGRQNRYGHPSPRTVAALRAAGARVLRTDEAGAIAVAGEGGGLHALVRDPSAPSADGRAASPRGQRARSPPPRALAAGCSAPAAAEGPDRM